jgi:hypothetical protein
MFLCGCHCGDIISHVLRGEDFFNDSGPAAEEGPSEEVPDTGG